MFINQIKLFSLISNIYLVGSLTEQKIIKIETNKDRIKHYLQSYGEYKVTKIHV